MEGFDTVTWMTITSEEEHENDPCAIIEDMISSFVYRMDMDSHYHHPGECGLTKIGPLSLILHIDNSHYDLHRHVYVTPIVITLGLSYVATQ